MRRLIAALLAGLPLTISTASAETLRVSYNVAAGASWDLAAHRFKDLVEEGSGGEITIELYPNATLAQGNDRVEIEMTQAGAIDIVIKSSGWLSSLDPRWSALALPWIFPDHATANAVLAGPVGETLDARLMESGLVPLAWSESGGFFHVYTTEKPISSPDDLAGVKLRLPGIPPWVGVFEALGAVPVTMSFAEVFPALQAGAVEGGTSQVGLFHSSRFYEVAKYMTFLNFAWDAIGILVNGSSWDNLSEDDQALLRTSAEAAMGYHHELVLQEEEELVGSLKEEGVSFTELSPQELAVFKEQAKPVYEHFKAEIDEDFVIKIEEQVEQLTN